MHSGVTTNAEDIDVVVAAEMIGIDAEYEALVAEYAAVSV